MNNKCAIVIFFILLPFGSLSAQIVEHELKSDLWKTIKPDRKIPYAAYPDTSRKYQQLTPQKPQNTFLPNVMEAYNKAMGLSLDKGYEKYKALHPIQADSLAFKIDKKELLRAFMNSEHLEYVGGHFQNMVKGLNGGATFTVNISGGGKKKLSKKTKWILKNVYGVSDDELEDK